MYDRYEGGRLMSDTTIASIRAKIDERTAEILRSGTSGFMPVDNDVRGPATREVTANPLAVVAPPQASFVLQTADGKRVYTRDGNFVLRDGQIAVTTGERVLGYVGQQQLLQPLSVAKSDALLGRIEGLHVAANGDISYQRRSIDPMQADEPA